MIGSGARVRKTLAVQLTLGFALLLMPAAAQATLLIKSDGAGLLVRDKNGDVNDSSGVRPENDGREWRISNSAPFDLIKFDAQSNCEAPPFSASATCERFSRKVKFEMRGGNDFVLNSDSGADSVVDAGSGNDRIFTGGGRDELIGSSGGDQLKGGAGNDLVVGGFGADVLDGGTGVDDLRGNEDSDTITSKEPDGNESEADNVTCGAGVDLVIADLKDVVASSGCQEIDRSPVGETPHVVLPRNALNVGRSGVARVRLRCPRRTTIGCRGTLSLRLAQRGSKRPAKTRYAIRAGRSGTVSVRLTAREARRVRGRGILTSIERGKLGPKTTIRQPRLR